MRTTLTIDDDVLEKARAIATRRRAPFRQVINEALRFGLETVEASASSKPYRTRPNSLGLKRGKNLDNIQELLAQIEAEDSR
jgi:hypothetical protein